MATFRLVHSETVELTHELAEKFANMEPSRLERPLNKKRMNYLRSVVEENQSITFLWAKLRYEDDEDDEDNEKRANGQHSSKLLASLNGTFPANLSAHIDTYVVDDEQGEALLFRQFDSRASSRTSADVSNAYQKLNPALDDVPPAIAKAGIEAINWYEKWVLGLKTLTGDNVYIKFNDERYQDFLCWLPTILGEQGARDLRVNAVIAAMYGTCEANTEKAAVFWESVLRYRSDKEPESSPIARLATFLTQAKLRKLSKQPLPAFYYFACAEAWRHFVNDVGMSAIKTRIPPALEAPVIG